MYECCRVVASLCYCLADLRCWMVGEWTISRGNRQLLRNDRKIRNLNQRLIPPRSPARHPQTSHQRPLYQQPQVHSSQQLAPHCCLHGSASPLVAKRCLAAEYSISLADVTHSVVNRTVLIWSQLLRFGSRLNHVRADTSPGIVLSLTPQLAGATLLYLWQLSATDCTQSSSTLRTTMPPASCVRASE